jgi:hypothetical protein
MEHILLPYLVLPKLPALQYKNGAKPNETLLPSEEGHGGTSPEFSKDFLSLGGNESDSGGLQGQRGARPPDV